MKLPLNKDYLDALNNRSRSKTRIDNKTYKDAPSAGKRIRDIVTTSRGCSIPPDVSEELWTDLLKDALDLLSGDFGNFCVKDGLGGLASLTSMCQSVVDMSYEELKSTIERRKKPGTAVRLSDFDLWMLMLIVALARRINRSMLSRKKALGIAQKVVNLTIKDHWALGRVNKQMHGVLHIPLDRGSLLHISRKRLTSSQWKSWTLVALDAHNCVEYLRIQKCFRIFFQSSTPFQSTMELDQVWWATMSY